MGIVAKQSVWNSIILFAGAFLGAVNTVLLFPKMLSQSEIGLTAMLINISIIAAQLSSFGMPSVLIRFVPKYRKGKGENGGLLRFVLGTSLFGGFVISIALFFCKDLVLKPYEKGAELLSLHYLLIIPLLLFTILSIVLNNYYRSILKSVFQNFIQEVFIRVCKTAVLVLYFFDTISFDVFVLLFVMVYAFAVLILIINLARMGEFNLSSIKSNNLVEKKVELYKYGVANFLTGFAYNISNRIDVLMIGAMIIIAGNDNAGLQATGIYTIASFIAAMIEMPGRALSNVAATIVAKAWIENDKKTILMMYRKSSINQFLFGGLLFILIWTNIDSIILIFNNLSEKHEDYTMMKYVVLFLALAKLFNTLSGINGNIIITSKYYWVTSIFMVVLLVLTVATNWILIPIYGVAGAALATAISVFAFNILSFIFLQIKFSIQPFTLKTVYLLMISLFVLFLAEEIPSLVNPFVDILIKSGLIVVLYFPLILVFKISEDVNVLFLRLLGKRS